MTQLWLIRHGQTDWNLEGRYQGQKDIPLNDTGLNQAFQLAASLNGQRFSAIYSSDLIRAQQTAEALSRHTGLTVNLDSRLREINLGEWEGLVIKDVVTAFPQARPDFYVQPDIPRAPGGESLIQVSARTCEAADEISESFPHGTVLVVSHGLAIATLLRKVEHLTYASIYSLKLENAEPRVIQWPPSQ